MTPQRPPTEPLALIHTNLPIAATSRDPCFNRPKPTSIQPSVATHPPMPPSFQHDYDASTAGLTTALAAVERDAAALGFGPATQTKLRLVVEELYTNVLRHSAGAVGPVRISLQRVAPGQARLQFEDGATAFDPFNATAAAITAAELHAPVQDRPVGRLGMVLVRGLAVSATYVRDTG